LTFGWRFHAGDTTGAAALATKDGAWRLVDLPHDFQIEQPWVAPDAAEKVDNSDPGANITSRLSGRGFKEMGKAWYRYHLTPHDSLRGRRLLLDFAGIMYVGDVYLNGELIGGTDYGYVGFEIDVTNKLRFGRDNVIAVLADTRNPENSRWYTGGGLIRGVKFVATPRDLYLARYPLRITTRDNRFVSVSVEYTNRTRSKEIPVRLQIVSPDGKTVYDDVTTARNKTASRTIEYRLPEVEVNDAQLWDTEHPNLYTAKVSLLREDGTVADDCEEHFGIRTVEFGPSFGMKLNGRKVLLKGYANHHALGALGAAAYPRAIEKRILLMKKFGINHIRTSHNPYSREFIELCDKYGILVVDELYDKWTRQYTGGRVPFEQLWQKDVPEWVKRDRNSPSVILWSLGNELQQDPNQPFNDFGVTMYRLMRVLVNRYDSTRLTTVAMHPRYRSWETDSLPCELAKVTDIQAYNYRYMYFPGDGRRFPWMTFYQSEASVAAMGQNYFEMDLDKVIGMAYWGAIDYLGESQGWPAKGWPQGVFDIALNPKPKAYYMKSYFMPDEPLVHIGVVERKGSQPWNGVQTGNDSMSDHWNRQPGQRLSLITYTNAEEVELILNGKSLGTQPNNIADPKARNQIRWNNVVYEPGYIEAVARTSGKVVARHRIETTDKPAALVAQADNDQWQADGMDLQHIDIRIVDGKGRLIQTVDDEVTFQVEGDARIVGVINGYIASNEMTIGNKRRLFNGHCTVILRAGRKPGKVTLSATIDGLKTTKVKLQTL
jgi:beta-galactosidase